jgi:hypothetical protein
VREELLEKVWIMLFCNVRVTPTQRRQAAGQRLLIMGEGGSLYSTYEIDSSRRFAVKLGEVDGFLR